MKKNNPDTTRASTGIFLANGGSYAVKKAIEITGAFTNGISLEGSTITEHAIRLPLNKGINFGGIGKTTTISSNTGGPGLSIVCDNVTSMTLNSSAISIPNGLCFLQNDGVPTSTTGQGYAKIVRCVLTI